MFVDTHCHLTDERYENIDSLCLDTLNNQVDFAICVGYDVPSSQKSLNVAEKYSQIYFTAGVHPDTANDYNQTVESQIENMAKHNKCVAIGEIGLDYHYDGFIKQNQINAFESQIKLANKLNLPISVHSRDSTLDTLTIIKGNKNLLSNVGVLHCFSGSKEVAKEYLDLDFYLSFGGTLTYKNSLTAKEVCKYAPIDRILTETDCPYLTPQIFRGQINYPKYVRYVVEEIAKLKEIEVNIVAKQVKQNAKNLFTKIK